MKTLGGCLHNHWAVWASCCFPCSLQTHMSCFPFGRKFMQRYKSHSSSEGKEKSRDAERVTSVGQMKNCFCMKFSLNRNIRDNKMQQRYMMWQHRKEKGFSIAYLILLNMELSPQKRQFKSKSQPGTIHKNIKENSVKLNADVKSLIHPCLLKTMSHKNNSPCASFCPNWLPDRRITLFKCRFPPGVVLYCLTFSKKWLPVRGQHSPYI